MSERVDEAAHRQSLAANRIVDSLPETTYDEIVGLASKSCDEPSLLDRDLQWFKACKGFEPGQRRRDEAFCHHAIHSVARGAGSAELVVVLQGGDNAATLADLVGRLPEFECQWGLKVLHAHADSESGTEALHSVFHRADLALTRAKDDWCEASAA